MIPISALVSDEIQRRLLINEDDDIDPEEYLTSDGRISEDGAQKLEMGGLSNVKKAALAAYRMMPYLELDVLPEFSLPCARSRVDDYCTVVSAQKYMLEDPLVSVLLLCASIEFKLREIYTLIVESQNDPNVFGRLQAINFNSMLISGKLREFMGESLHRVIEYVICAPEGINLRNLAWHGYLLQNDVHPAWPALLLSIAVSIVRRVRELELSNGIENLSREVAIALDAEMRLPVDSGDRASVLRAFNGDYDEIGHFLSLSKSIDLYLEPYCRKVVEYLKKGNHIECISTMLVLLERGLRFLYVQMNGLTTECLSARLGVYFHTLDELLGPTVEETPLPTYKSDLSKAKNQLVDAIPAPAIALLNDLLVYESGTQLRDRLGHGYVYEAMIANDRFVDDLLLALLLIFSRFSGDTNRKLPIGLLNDYSSKYESRTLLIADIQAELEEISNLVVLLAGEGVSMDMIGQWRIEIERLRKKAKGEEKATGMYDRRIREEEIAYEKLRAVMKLCHELALEYETKFKKLVNLIATEQASSRQERSYLSLRNKYSRRFVERLLGTTGLVLSLIHTIRHRSKDSGKSCMDKAIELLMSMLQNGIRSLSADTERILNHSEIAYRKAERLVSALS